MTQQETNKFRVDRAKQAKVLVNKINELFHLQETKDWQLLAETSVIVGFIERENKGAYLQENRMMPFVNLAKWLLENKEHEVFNAANIPKSDLDFIKNHLGYTAE